MAPLTRCLNPRCGELGRVPLCASCQLAGACGAVLAFVVGFALKLAGVL